MIFEPSAITSCLKKAREMSALYAAKVSGEIGVAKSIDDLLWLCETVLGKKIIVQEVDFLATGKTMAASCLTYDDRYEIFIAAGGMDRPMRRFALCKELFQMLLDDEACRTVAIYEHLDEIAAKLPDLTGRPSPAAASEWLAEAAAMEFCFPYQERESALQTAEQQDGITLADSVATLATKYAIPESFADEYLTAASMKYFLPFKNS